MNHRFLRILGLLMISLLSSCALGTSKINIKHGPLPTSSVQHGSTIYVRQFTDSRKVEDKTSVGNKRNGFGMVLGGFSVKGGKSVAQTMTEHVADALRAAGYNAEVEGSRRAAGAPVLEGDVHEFWLDLYTAVWHNAGVDLKLKNSAGATVWQKRVNGSKTNVLWIGVNAEIEKVVRQAIDEMLNEAVAGFSSGAFAAKAR